MSASQTPPTRNARHTRDDVARAALGILDEFGLADLTMRRLAAELEVQPSALYWHFPNKQTLLAEIADRIAGRGSVVVDPAADWMTVASAEANSLRDALLAYRDGAEVVSSSFALGLGREVPLRRLVKAVALGGFDDQTSRRVSTVLLHFILGHVSHEQQRMQYDSIGVAAGGEQADALEAPGNPAPAATADFEFGVRLLLTGLRSLESDFADTTR